MQKISKLCGWIGGLAGLFVTFLWFPLLVKILGLKEAIDTYSYHLMWTLGGWRYNIIDIAVSGILLLIFSFLSIWLVWKGKENVWIQISCLFITAVSGLLLLFHIWLIPFIFLGLSMFFVIFERQRMGKICCLLGGIAGIVISIYWPVMLEENQNDIFQNMFLLGGWKHFVFPFTVVELGLLALTFLCMFMIWKEKELQTFHHAFLIGTSVIGLILLPFIWFLPCGFFLLTVFLSRKANKV
ncbi:hypothetical protein [Thermoflavimicrobium dichotomicum]|uniref:Uncharacterized protein n=1 Tax=Thermoflavimicrobium dichotomicum TaxID=46223 RepID=A0A1I3Q656_9BACL|nr:hypothetical protein [Thermoflavimicrobium dichotomicum]SFJ29150.1 hypothetical protein SAMN05421852_10723 [Thermoflavimicrobium dichotomicum]